MCRAMSSLRPALGSRWRFHGPLRRFVNTLRTHHDGVLAFIGSGLTNAISEGLNRVIKIVKNRASGFHNLNPFTDMIFLTVGDVYPFGSPR